MNTSSLSCFKQYDVRGKVPEILNPVLAYCIGKACAEEFSASRVVTGRDARLSSAQLQAALAAGLEAGGARVVNIGLCATEEIYFAAAIKAKTGEHAFDAGIMITGSHNPANENGLKFVRGGALPVSGATGLLRVRNRAAAFLQDLAPEQGADFAPAHEEAASFREQYLDFLCSLVGRPRPRRHLRLHLDPGNGCAGLLAPTLCERLGLEWSAENLEPDGSFPNGIPNPLLPEKRENTSKAVRAARADMGIAWDGDADRCFFYDENGDFLEGYYLVGLLAERILRRHPGGTIVHDPRLYWNTQDLVRSLGGISCQSKTGHSLMKESMRATNAVYGGEMSAHHYFRDFHYCDSGMIPWLLVAAYMAEEDCTLAEKIQSRAKLYPCSGELNFKVGNPEDAIKKVREFYAGKSVKEEHVDGLSMEFGNWRFNLRPSNTEALIRLNVESRGDRALMEDKTGELSTLITSQTEKTR